MNTISHIHKFFLISFITFCLSLPSYGQSWKELYDQASGYFNSEEYDQALESASYALERAHETFGEGSEYHLATLRLLVFVTYQKEDFTRSKNFASKEITLRKANLASGNVLEYAKAENFLGLNLLALDELEEAEVHFSDAKKIFESISETNNIDFARVLFNLANLRYLKGEYQEAFQLQQKMLPIFAQLLEEADYEIGSAYYAFGLSSFGTSNYQEAENAFNTALKIYSLYHEEGDDELIQINNDLATLYVNQDQFDKAYLKYKGLATAKTDSQRFEEEEIAEFLYQYGLSAYKTNQKDESIRLLEESIRLSEKSLGKNSKLYSNTSSILAIAYQSVGKSSEAEKLLSEIGQNDGSDDTDPISKANALNNLATIQLNQGKIEEAEKYYWQAISLIPEDRKFERGIYGSLLENLAAMSRNKGELLKADSLLEVAYAYFEEGFDPNHPKIPAILISQASLGIALGNYPRAVNQLSNAKQLLLNQKSGESIEYANLLNVQASMYQNQGKYEEAEDSYRQAIRIRAKVTGENNNEFATLLNNLATLFQTRGWYAKAKENLERSLLIKSGIYGQSHHEFASALENLGLLYMDLGMQDQSQEYLEKALDIYRVSFGENHPKYANALLNLARLELARGNYSKAEPLYQTSLQLLRKHQGENNLAFALANNSFAVMYQTMGNFNAAEPLYKQSIGVYEKLYGKLHPEYSTSLENLASLYEMMGESEKAMTLMKEALEIDMQVLGPDHPSTATTIQNLASLYQMAGLQEEALGLYEQALEITKQTFGMDHPSYANTLFNLAVLNQRLGKMEEAEKQFLQAMSIREKILGKQHPDYFFSQYGLAVLYQVTGRDQKAKPLFQSVIHSYLDQVEKVFPSLSEKEKSAFYAKIYPVIEAYQDFAIEYASKDKDLEDHVLVGLYDLQLATKALLLNAGNKVKNSIMKSRDSDLISLYQQWIEQKEELAKFYAFSLKELEQQGVNLAVLETKANETEKQLSARSNAFSTQFDKQSITWKDIKASLKVDEAAIEILRIRKNLANDSIVYAFLIIKNTSEIPELVLYQNGKELDDRSFRYYKNAVRYQFKDERSYDFYWKLLGQKLSNHRRLYISADGIFNKVSLSTLFDPSTGKYVLDNHDIFLLSNSKELLDAKKTKFSDNNTVVLLGFPDYNSLKARGESIDLTFQKILEQNKGNEIAINDETFRGGISYLPGTKIEVEKLDSLFAKSNWKRNIYLFDKAKEENVKELNSPRVLHIATHGYFLSDLDGNQEGKAFGIHMNNANNNPLLRSGLLFSGSESAMGKIEDASYTVALEEALEDGILTAYEAMNLNLDNTELVVLSACETGLGEVRNGEGVFGLQRAFQVAGADNIVMSLWKVNDATTQELMTIFYSLWLGGKDKMTAFKEAQLQLKEKYAHPYFWGAFVMIGT